MNDFELTMPDLYYEFELEWEIQQAKKEKAGGGSKRHIGPQPPEPMITGDTPTDDSGETEEEIPDEDDLVQSSGQGEIPGDKEYDFDQGDQEEPEIPINPEDFESEEVSSQYDFPRPQKGDYPALGCKEPEDLESDDGWVTSVSGYSWHPALGGGIYP